MPQLLGLVRGSPRIKQMTSKQTNYEALVCSFAIFVIASSGPLAFGSTQGYDIFSRIVPLRKCKSNCQSSSTSAFEVSNHSMLPSRNLICKVVRQQVAYLSKERAGKSIRPGAAIVLDGVPHRVTKMNQGKRGKGGGFVRATLKNLLTDNTTFEKTFTSDEIVEHADLEKTTCKFSWTDGVTYTFFDDETFEEVQLNKDDVDCKDLLFEGQSVKLLWFNGNVIGVELPIICEYKVDGINESTVTPDNKVAMLNCGVSINVPSFVERGDSIRVNTVEIEYIDRVN